MHVDASVDNAVAHRGIDHDRRFRSCSGDLPDMRHSRRCKTTPFIMRSISSRTPGYQALEREQRRRTGPAHFAHLDALYTVAPINSAPNSGEAF
jgi:hypothetical protein